MEHITSINERGVRSKYFAETFGSHEGSIKGRVYNVSIPKAKCGVRIVTCDKRIIDSISSMFETGRVDFANMLLSAREEVVRPTTSPSFLVRVERENVTTTNTLDPSDYYVTSMMDGGTHLFHLSMAQ